jgi:hypothetical protein
MLRRRRFMSCVLISASAGLWIGLAFGESNQLTDTARPGPAFQAQPSPQAIQLYHKTQASQASGQPSQVKTIAPQLRSVPEEVEPKESPWYFEIDRTRPIRWHR